MNKGQKIGVKHRKRGDLLPLLPNDRVFVRSMPPTLLQDCTTVLAIRTHLYEQHHAKGVAA